jgi:hypothetical protein
MATSTTLALPTVRAERDLTVSWAAIAVYLFSAGMILGGILLAPRDHPTRWFEEKQTLTSYSAALLYSASLTCFLNYLATRQMRYLGLGSARESTFWAMGSFGFFFLMTDEYFVMHEGIGRFITHRLLNLPRSGPIDRLDAFVVGSYGVVGLYLLFHHRKYLASIRWFFGFLAVGAIMATVSLLFDLGEDGIANVYIEDGAKILANASFLLACIAAAYGYYRQLVARLR